MPNDRKLSPARALAMFLIALAGSVTGILLGPVIIDQFAGAPVWLLPAIMILGVLLALLAGALAFKLTTRQ